MPIKANKFESELIAQFQMLDQMLFGQRGTHSDGVDVLLFRPSPRAGLQPAGLPPDLLAWRFEVKSSKAETQSLKDTAKMWEQYQGYLRILKEFGIQTYYAFRCKSTKVRGEDVAAKWRIWAVDKLPRGRNGVPHLTLKTDKGWTIAKFYEYNLWRR